MQLKALGLTSLLALLSAPAIAQDNAESTQQALEFESKALEQYEAECRSLYHKVFQVGNTRYLAGATKEEARERFLTNPSQEQGIVTDSLESMIDAFYDQLPDAPPDSLYSKRIIRDMAVTYYGFCMGVINE